MIRRRGVAAVLMIASLYLVGLASELAGKLWSQVSLVLGALLGGAALAVERGRGSFRVPGIDKLAVLAARFESVRTRYRTLATLVGSLALFGAATVYGATNPDLPYGYWHVDTNP